MVERSDAPRAAPAQVAQVAQGWRK